MKYTGINPSATNRIASGSLGVFVENTRVGTFGTDSLVVSGSTVLSSSLDVIGNADINGIFTVSGSTVLSGSIESIGLYSQTGDVNILGNTTITGSTILSSSLSIIGTETIQGDLNTIGVLSVSGSAIVSSSLEVIGTETLTGSLNVSGSSEIIGALNTLGEFLVTGSAIISSSLSVIGQQSVEGVLQAIGSFFTTGSAIISSSLSVIGTSNVEGTSFVTGSSVISGSLVLEGPAVITGSVLITGSTDIQGDTGINGTLSITGSEFISGSTEVTTIQGSTAGGQLFNVLGTAGQMFSVTDGLSGSLFSVNTISGLPLLEVFSDETINIGKFGSYPIKTSGSVAIITGSFTGSYYGVGNLPTLNGPVVVTGSSNVLSVQASGLESTVFDVNGPSGQLFSVVDSLSGSLFSVNNISGLPVMEVFSDNSVSIGQYSNPILTINTGSVNVTLGNLTVNTGSIIISKSGSGATDPLFDVEGAQGQLFSVIDSFSGSLMSVNDISGFPILDVRSDDTITMGTFGSNALVVSQSNVIIGVTASAAPAYTGRDGEIKFGVSGGNYFMFVYLAGKWRSGSLSA